MATYSYDSLDRVTGTTLANSTSVVYSYDLRNRLGYVHNALNGGNRSYSYVYDGSSRITSTAEPRGTVASGYTERNDVSNINGPSGLPFADQSFTTMAGSTAWAGGGTRPRPTTPSTI